MSKPLIRFHQHTMTRDERDFDLVQSLRGNCLSNTASTSSHGMGDFKMNRICKCALAALVTVLVGCSGSSSDPDAQQGSQEIQNGENFVPIARSLATTAAAGTSAANVTTDRDFYIAIRRSALSQKWFLSAFLTQVEPVSENNLPVVSLGTKVVTFKEQNGYLYVFDVADGKAWSPELNPTVVVDAYPVITSDTFNKLPGASDYILINPVGLNHFTAYSDTVAPYGGKFTVELTYSERFRRSGDSMTYDQVFTGYGDVPDFTGTVFDATSPYRSSGTLTMTLRPYFESGGFVKTPVPFIEGGGSIYFDALALIDGFTDGPTKLPATKWNLNPKAKPIPWVISPSILDWQKDPQFADYDLVKAIKAGIEAWNDALGYKAFEAKIANSTQSVGDESQNYFFVDSNPTASFAFADWRANPNTGETRAASIYFSSAWLYFADVAAQNLSGASGIAAGQIVPTVADLRDLSAKAQRTALAKKRPSRVKHTTLTLDGWTRQEPCDLDAGEAMDRLRLQLALAKVKGTSLAVSGMTKKQIGEAVLTAVIAHEIGHTLGLRHNFKGSLKGPVSTSIMDYLVDAEKLSVTKPGTYDVAAVRYLYGLDSRLPQDPFCNDAYVSLDPECQKFDSGPDPWRQQNRPTYLDIVYNFNFAAFTFGLDLETDVYARGSKNLDVRDDAFNTLMLPARPIDPALLAQNSDYAWWFDILGESALGATYLHWYDNFLRLKTPISSDYDASTIATVTSLVLNQDGIRSYQSRATGVDVLNAIHTTDALVALANLQKKLHQVAPVSDVDAAQLAALQGKVDRTLANWIP